MIQPHEAYRVRRLLTGEASNGEADALSGPFRRLANLMGLEVKDHPKAFASCYGLDDPEAAIAAVAAYDSDPPQAKAPGRKSGGRPPEKIDEAIAFLVEKLSTGDHKGCELIAEWKARGEAISSRAAAIPP